MSLTLDEILQCEDRLQAEIAERECLLAAVQVLKGYVAKGRSLEHIELGLFGRALLTGEIRKPLLLESAVVEKAIVAPPQPPALPPPPPYLHPELAAIGRLHGSDTLVVQWAIGRMTNDYTLKDIEALLKREGFSLRSAKISVILTRLKGRGEIEEIRRGMGPNPALFRKPKSAEPEALGIDLTTTCADGEIECTETPAPVLAAA